MSLTTSKAFKYMHSFGQQPYVISISDCVWAPAGFFIQFFPLSLNEALTEEMIRGTWNWQ